MTINIIIIKTNLFFIFALINMLPISWGYATIASVIKSKSLGEDDSWKKHTHVGFESVRFFLIHILFVLVLLFILIALSSLGKILEEIEKTIGSLE